MNTRQGKTASERENALSAKALEYYSMYAGNEDLPKYFCGAYELTARTTSPTASTHIATAPHTIPEVIVEDCDATPGSPTSSITSTKKLEWDSGADIGYANYNRSKSLHKSTSMPILKRNQGDTTISETEEENTEKSGGEQEVDEEKKESLRRRELLKFLRQKVGEPVAESTPVIETIDLRKSGSDPEIYASKTPMLPKRKDTHVQQKRLNTTVFNFEVGAASGEPENDKNTVKESSNVVPQATSQSSENTINESMINRDIYFNRYRVNILKNLLISRPINVECYSSVPKTDCQTQTSLTDDKENVPGTSIAIQTSRRSSKQEILYLIHPNLQYHTSSSNTTSTSNAPIEIEQDPALSHCNSFEYVSGLSDKENMGPVNKSTTSTMPSSSKESSSSAPDKVELEKSLRIMKKLIKSKKYNEDVKELYIRKMAHKIITKSNEKMRVDHSSESDKIVPQLGRRSRSQPQQQDWSSSSSTKAVNHRSSAGATNAHWKSTETHSEKLYSSVDTTDSPKEEIVNFAKRERETQLNWINNEIEHLAKLKSLLESKKKPIRATTSASVPNLPEYQQSTAVYMITTEKHGANGKCDENCQSKAHKAANGQIDFHVHNSLGVRDYHFKEIITRITPDHTAPSHSRAPTTSRSCPTINSNNPDPYVSEPSRCAGKCAHKTRCCNYPCCPNYHAEPTCPPLSRRKERDIFPVPESPSASPSRSRSRSRSSSPRSSPQSSSRSLNKVHADKKNAPTADKKNASTADKKNAPTGDRKNTLTADKKNSPTGDRKNTPTGDKNTLTADKKNSPTGDRRNAPTGDKKNTLTADKKNSPTGGRKNDPTGDQKNTLTANKKNAPMDDWKNAPTADQELKSADRTKSPRKSCNNQTCKHMTAKTTRICIPPGALSETDDTDTLSRYESCSKYNREPATLGPIQSTTSDDDEQMPPTKCRCGDDKRRRSRNEDADAGRRKFRHTASVEKATTADIPDRRPIMPEFVTVGANTQMPMQSCLTRKRCTASDAPCVQFCPGCKTIQLPEGRSRKTRTQVCYDPNEGEPDKDAIIAELRNSFHVEDKTAPIKPRANKTGQSCKCGKKPPGEGIGDVDEEQPATPTAIPNATEEMGKDIEADNNVGDDNLSSPMHSAESARTESSSVGSSEKGEPRSVRKSKEGPESGASRMSNSSRTSSKKNDSSNAKILEVQMISNDMEERYTNTELPYVSEDECIEFIPCPQPKFTNGGRCSCCNKAKKVCVCARSKFSKGISCARTGPSEQRDKGVMMEARPTRGEEVQVYDQRPATRQAAVGADKSGLLKTCECQTIPCNITTCPGASINLDALKPAAVVTYCCMDDNGMAPFDKKNFKMVKDLSKINLNSAVVISSVVTSSVSNPEDNIRRLVLEMPLEEEDPLSERKDKTESNLETKLDTCTCSDPTISSATRMTTVGSTSTGVMCSCCGKLIDSSESSLMMGDVQAGQPNGPFCFPCYHQSMQRDWNPQDPYYRHPEHNCQCYTRIDEDALAKIRDTLRQLAEIDNVELSAAADMLNNKPSDEHLVCQACNKKIHRDKAIKKPVAYVLKFETSDDVDSESDEKPSQQSLQEITVKVPVKKIKASRKASSRTDSDKSSDASRNPKHRAKNLQECLSTYRPDFVRSAEERRRCMIELAYMRAQRGTNYQQLLALSNGIPTQKPGYSEQKKKRLFSTKEMKRMTAKHYKKLPEVQQKLIDNRNMQFKKANRLLANIFNKKLRENVLRGQPSLSTSINVITMN